jgi:predicted nucleic acid-binding protein
LPTDAYHIAIALEAGVNAFVTLDMDFLRVDGLVVYTCVPNPSG